MLPIFSIGAFGEYLSEIQPNGFHDIGRIYAFAYNQNFRQASVQN
jgi:hypothetical protein